MPRSVAELPMGTRLTDHISLGVIAKTFPPDVVERVLAETGRQSKRQRDLPAHVVVYYVIALALYLNVSSGEVLRCLLESIRWLAGRRGQMVKVAGRSGISQARTRLGVEPVRLLHDQVVAPIAMPVTRGAFYRSWRLVSLDGSSLDVADTAENEAAFGRPGASRGHSAYPKIRFVSLVENGTHVLFATEVGSYKTSEMELAARVVPALREGMLCLADRGLYSFALWSRAAETGADLLFRMRKNCSLPCQERLEDGSYISRLRPKGAGREQGGNIPVRVIEYALDGVEGAEPSYRLMTTILEPERASAGELAALYQERWEIETALDELKTHLKGPGIVLRSRTPELVLQEFYGLMMAHFAIRGLMHEAALSHDVDPDRLSYTHAVRVIRRKMPLYVLTPPPEDRPAFHEATLLEILDEMVAPRRGRRNQRAVKRKMSNYPVCTSPRPHCTPVNVSESLRILK